MPMTLSVSKSGNDLRVWATNTGDNIILIERMVLEVNQSHWIFIREGGFFDFEIGGGRLEQGLGQLKFKMSYPSATKAKVTAEFMEVRKRANTPLTNL